MERDFSCCYYNYYDLVAILQKKNKAAANSLSKQNAHYFFW